MVLAFVLVRRDREKKLLTLRYFICGHPKSLGLSTPYPAPFPQCFHAGRDHNEAETGTITPWKPIPRCQLAKAAAVKAVAAPPGNGNAVKHGLHSYKAMLNGNGLDERTSLFKALREKEQELFKALGRRSITTRAGHHRRLSEKHALHCQPG